MLLIIRSGLSILWDHPRLYTNVHCTPNSEWIRFTPTKVPTDRLYTANDDQRYLSPWLGLPGFRHTIGMARHWHFLSDLLWIKSIEVVVSEKSIGDGYGGVKEDEEYFDLLADI